MKVNAEEKHLCERVIKRSQTRGLEAMQAFQAKGYMLKRVWKEGTSGSLSPQAPHTSSGSLSKAPSPQRLLSQRPPL